MIFPKFIIEEDNLILSKVSYHKDLVTDKTKVKGGGWFRYENDNNDTLIFYGESIQFSCAKLEDIRKCVEEKKIFSNKQLTNNISEKHNFAYDTGSEIINLI